MHIALDSGDDDLALGLDVATGCFKLALFVFDIGHQVGHSRLHHTGALDDLGQKHLALAEQIADHIHAGHQRAFDHMQRPAALGRDRDPGFFGVQHDEIGDAVHQGVREPLVHIAGPPGQARAIVQGHAFGALGHLNQALTTVGAAIQHDVFDSFSELSVEVVVHAHHPGVDDAHVHAGLDRVVQKHGVDGFAHRLVAAEAETHVGHAAADLGTGQVLFDPARRVDEINRVVVVLLDAGGDGKDVRVEDDVLGVEADFIDQDLVGPRADFDLALEGVGLAFFVKRHHHRRRAVAPLRSRSTWNCRS